MHGDPHGPPISQAFDSSVSATVTLEQCDWHNLDRVRTPPPQVTLQAVQSVQSVKTGTQSTSLQMEVSIKSASVAREQIPPIHVRVLVLDPSPQVALQLEYSDH